MRIRFRSLNLDQRRIKTEDGTIGEDKKRKKIEKRKGRKELRREEEDNWARKLKTVK